MSSPLSSAARLLAYRLLSEDGDLHHSEDGDHLHAEDEFRHSEDSIFHSEDAAFHDSHDGAAAGFGTSGVDAFSESSTNASDSSKPWGDVILASFLVQAVTVTGLIIAKSVRCCGAKTGTQHSRFWTLVTNILIPSFAGGALFATAIFLIIPEALHLVPLTDTTAAAVAASMAGGGHDDHSGHEGHDDHHDEDHEDEMFGTSDVHDSHEDHEGHDHRYYHYRFLQEDHDEPDQPWKVGAAIIGGFLFPILFWIIFPRHGLEECEQCEVLKEEIDASKMRHASLMASQKLKDQEESTMRDECDAGCCEHAAHQKSELSVWEEEDEDNDYEDDPDIEYHDGYPDPRSSSHVAFESAAVPEIRSTTNNQEEQEIEKPVASPAKKAAANTTRKPINWGLASSILVGDFFHNFTDGVFIGSAFLLCSRELGWTIVATTIYHELAQEIADFFLLTNHCHLKEWEALALNFVSGFSVLIGALMVLAIDLTDTAKGIVLAISAGVYLHIAGSECVPRAQSKCKKPLDAVVFLLCFIVGVIPIALVLLNHGHCEAGGHEGHGH